LRPATMTRLNVFKSYLMIADIFPAWVPTPASFVTCAIVVLILRRCRIALPRAHGGNGALAGVVTDTAGKITGLIETILTREGNKAEPQEPYVPVGSKRCIGHIKGNAVRLTGTAPIILCEGLEEAISINQASGQESWACGGIGFIGDVALPPHSHIVIARDCKDEADSKAAHKFKMALTPEVPPLTCVPLVNV
jgi:hypothetical protein